MPRTPRRRATLADLMGLVAGTALAFFAWLGFRSLPVLRGLPDSPQWYYFQAMGGVAFLAPLSLSLLVLALRPPRPRLRRMLFEPAIVVGFSVLFVMAFNTAALLAVLGLRGSPLASFADGPVIYYCRSIAEQVGMTVGSTWSLQAVAGRLRWPLGWMDLAGWVAGAAWILLALGSIVFTLL